MSPADTVANIVLEPVAQGGGSTDTLDFPQRGGHAHSIAKMPPGILFKAQEISQLTDEYRRGHP